MDNYSFSFIILTFLEEFWQGENQRTIFYRSAVIQLSRQIPSQHLLLKVFFSRFTLFKFCLKNLFTF